MNFRLRCWLATSSSINLFRLYTLVCFQNTTDQHFNPCVSKCNNTSIHDEGNELAIHQERHSGRFKLAYQNWPSSIKNFKESMNSIRLIALTLLGASISAAETLECNDQSFQCCWTIRAFQLMGGYDESVSDKYNWNLDNEHSCCHMDGVTCEETPSDNITIKSM